MDLGSMSTTDLRRLQTRIGAELQRRNESAKKNALKRMKKIAEEEGISFDDVISEIAGSAAAKPQRSGRKGASARGTKVSATKGSKVPPKYFHPDDPKIHWSGRGRKPQWVIDWLAQNKPIEALEKKAA